MEGLNLESYSRLRVIIACGTSWSYKCKGKALSVEQKLLMKWFLKVCIAFLLHLFDVGIQALVGTLCAGM